ncbi:MAG: ATP-dependent Clp protease ATP-binding subunit, partial [Minisyncoccia bacterium]
EKKAIELYKLQDEGNKLRSKIPVTSEDIAEVITQITGIPVKKLVSEEKERLKNLEKRLKKYIIGQDEAVDAIAKSVRRSRLGISNEKRPLGVFMFLGPTGVGKTELAKVLANVIYSRPDALIKVDMSEFMERHNISRLVGAPAGYVGYEEGGKLTEQVRMHPYSVILFDEVEKAHPDVFNLLLQIFEDGQLTDAAGRKVDFKNTVIIMTSNIGTDEMTDEANLGFSESVNLDENKKKAKIMKKYIENKDTIMKELKEEFRPEFVNRIDKIIIFNPLGEKDIKSILKVQFSEFKKRLAKNSGIRIEASGSALDFVAKKSFNPNEGARLIRRNMQEMVEDAISEKMINGEIGSGDAVKLNEEKGKIVARKIKK